MPEPKVGFIPSQIIPVRGTADRGEAPARDLAVTGRVIDAAEARSARRRQPSLRDGIADINRALKAVLDDVLRLEPQGAWPRWPSVWCCPARQGDDSRRARRGGGEPGRFACAGRRRAEGIEAFQEQDGTPSWTVG
jgi:isohexenylglutaconyl-CoA hydratase